jgi:hypothetical protein
VVRSHGFSTTGSVGSVEAQVASVKGSHSDGTSAHGNYGESSQELTPYQPSPCGPNSLEKKPGSCVEL